MSPTRKDPAEEAPVPLEAVDFVVDAVRITDAGRRYFDLTIEGKVLRLTPAQLASPRSFRTAFCEMLYRIPKVPPDDEVWRRIVNVWLTMADEPDEDAATLGGV